MAKANGFTPVTQKQLQEEFERFEDRFEKKLTDKFDKKIESLERSLRLDIVSSSLSLKHEVKDFIREDHDKIFTKIDPILKMLVKADQEMTAIAAE